MHDKSNDKCLLNNRSKASRRRLYLFSDHQKLFRKLFALNLMINFIDLPLAVVVKGKGKKINKRKGNRREEERDFLTNEAVACKRDLVGVVDIADAIYDDRTCGIVENL